jgi:hypothetical protein
MQDVSEKQGASGRDPGLCRKKKEWNFRFPEFHEKIVMGVA